MTKTEIFIEKAISKNGDIYDYSKVEYINSKSKVIIICKEHGDFYQRPNNHLKGQNCPICGINSRIIKRTKKDWLAEFISIHGNRYDYSYVSYIHTHKKVNIICKEHGDFYQTPRMHLSGQGCPKCSNTNPSNTIDFINKSKAIFGEKYDYSKTVYVNNKTKVELLCKEHGTFSTRPNNHLTGQICPKCNTNNKIKIDCISDFRYVHGNKYDYSLVDYIIGSSKVKIICKKHGMFEQTPNSHYKGSGCPNCKLSKGEERIQFLLKNIEFVIQKTYDDCLSPIGSKLKFDFYLPEYNMCIEYDGRQHFMPVKYFGGEEQFTKQKINDNIKNNYCKLNNINLLRIPYYDYDNIEVILREKLNI